MYGGWRDHKNLALQAIWPYNRVTKLRSGSSRRPLRQPSTKGTVPPAYAVHSNAGQIISGSKEVSRMSNTTFWWAPYWGECRINAKYHQNLWPYNRFLALHPINFRIGKSGPSQNWPYNRFGLTSEGHICDTYCNLSKLFSMVNCKLTQ